MPKPTTAATTSETRAPSCWLTKRETLTNYQIGSRRLDQWVSNGYVRSVKIDEKQQGRRVFSAADIDATLAALAVGKEPKIHAGRGTK